MDQFPNSTVKKPKGWGARHTLAILGFWGNAASYAMRFNLSIAIVAMVGHRKRENDGNTSQIETCSNLLHDNELNSNLTEENGSGKGDDFGEFDWSPAEQGFILGTFFWGYVATQLLGGILSSKYGGKWVFGIGLFVTALFALLTPLAARTHQYLMIAVRVIQGIGEGVTMPAMHTILAKWAPPEEKSTMTSLVFAGTNFGTAATLITSGYLIDGNVLGGWPSVFYFSGGISIIWFVLWCFLMHESPADHPSIDPYELNYIQKSLGTQVGTPKEKAPIPWRSIATSLPVWAIQVAHAGHAWGLYTLLAQMPTYMKTVLHFDIKQNSWMSAAPYILMWIVSIFTSQIIDILIGRKVVRTAVVRKVAQAVSQLGPALALIAASYSGCDRNVTVALLTVGVGISGVVYAGFVANFPEISSNYAGIVMGITNTFANLCGFGAPYVAGLIINKDPSLENWQLVFFLAAGIYFFNAIFYAIFGSATEQPWNKPKDTASKAEEAPVAFLREKDGMKEEDW